MEDDMSYAQGDYIRSLLETRRVSRACAEHILSLLLEQPPMNDTGMDTLKQIQRPR